MRRQDHAGSDRDAGALRLLRYAGSHGGAETQRVLNLFVACALAGASLSAQVSRPAASLQSKVDAYVREWQAQSSVPGVSVGIVLRDGTALTSVAGVADRASKTPLTPEDLMLAGSTGKTFFAALALQLIESGRLDLEAPISKYLGDRPWFPRLPNATSITVRHLMTHTSGLVRYEMNPRFTADLRARPDKVWSPEEEVAYLFDAAPPFPAGQGWDYSDTNYIVLGMIMEKITGTKAYDEIRKRFLAPLKLAGVVPQTGRVIPKLVSGYAGANDPLGLPDEMMVGGRLAINPQFEWAGGGFATSAGDLARWGHALYASTSGPITAEMRGRMIHAGVPARLGPQVSYGLGVIIRSNTPVGPVWGHSGFFPGYQSELVYAVDRAITVAVQISTSVPRATGNRSMLRVAYDLIALLPSRP
jgi:D-alanyl-D-alanine carboxypeptidase